MVFESIVVELINRFAGDYVENLDTKQLKIGLWGGDVVLNNLDLKGSALDDLDLPVKIKAGHVAKVTLKIPWKNLYTEPVIVDIEGIYALAVPNIAIQYNEEKEAKEKEEAKQKKLAKIEEAKKAEAEKGQPKEEKKDSFVEKMITQIIKNLQVNVSSIHVRYEDRFTDPKRPFSLGVSLHQLVFQTTDENWKPCILKEAVTQIYKLIRLDSLSVYWNSDSSLYEQKDHSELLDNLKQNVATGEILPGYSYLINPISSVAHLKLHTKPEKDNFSIPKMFLTLVFDNIAVSLHKKQYDDILQVLESFERMALLSLYRKYRPSVPLAGNAATWWHYAYQSVLEETVRRRRQMWSWEHIKSHRDTMRRYRDAYITKLSNNKVNSATAKVLEECEKALDVFNITVMRQQAEVQAAKDKTTKAEGKGRWFGGLFGGKKKDKKEPSSIETQFYQAYNADEKEKLYAAIGYQENEADPTLPPEFVAVQLVTKLNSVSVTLLDDNIQGEELMKLELTDLFASVGQRPAANALKYWIDRVEAKIDDLSICGAPQGDITPHIVSSQAQDTEAQLCLMNMKFETNPEAGCDTRIILNARPLQIVYDAVTINHLANFFKPPESVHLKQLSEAAMATFDEIKEQSSTGLQHAIEQHKYTDIQVDVKPAYVIVPYSGLYTEDAAMLLVDLGNLKVSTKKNTVDATTSSESLETVMSKAYDVFNIQLQTIQALYVPQGEDWRAARKQVNSDLHILRPISIDLCIEKCMIENDPRMPKLKVGGGLPLVSVNMSDHRLQHILSLVQSIPLPESAPPVDDDIFTGPSTLPTASIVDPSSTLVKSTTDNDHAKPPLSPGKEHVNYIDVLLDFEVKEVCVNLAQHKEGVDVPIVKLVIDRVGASLKVRTYDMLADAYLGAVYVQYLKLRVTDSLAASLSDNTVTNGGAIVNLINTPVSGDSFKLLTLSYIQAKEDGPEFASTYEKTQQTIVVHFSMMEIVCHQSAILSLIDFAQTLQPPTAGKPDADRPQLMKDEGTVVKKTVSGQASPAKKRTTRKMKEVDPHLVNIRLKATLDSFGVVLCNDDVIVMDVRIKGIDAGVKLQPAKTSVAVILRDLTVTDPTPSTFYPRIVCIEGSEVLKADVVIYNDGTKGDKCSDMSCVDTSILVSIGQIKVTFLNKFVNAILAYVSKFQVPQDALKDVGDSMAEYSKDAMQNIQETASLISLDVQMKAPLITVPLKSTSRNVLMVDLGHLRLENKFELAEASSSATPAVLDRMKIELYSLKFVRALLASDDSVQDDVELLEPISLKIQLCRNLSAGWYHGHPDIDVSGSLGAIAVNMTQSDLRVIMSTLQENLQEGENPVEHSVPATKVTTDPHETSKAKRDDKADDKALDPGSPARPAEEAYRKLAFDFKLRGLSLCLYKSQGEAIDQHEATNALARVTLEEFSLAGSMMSNTAMEVKVLLKDTVLDDLLAEHQGGITRMVRRNGDAEGNMIDVAFSQDSEANKDIVVTIDSIYACIYVHFLMTVADFFIKGMQPTDTPQAVASPAGAKDKKDKKDNTRDAPKAAPGPPERPTAVLRVALNLAKPDIILVEDPKNHSTNAIILETEIDFKMSVTPDITSIIGNVTGFQLYSCIYDRRDTSKSQILPPAEVSLILKQEFGGGQHIDIQMTDILLSVSPPVIRTLTSVMSGLSPPETVETASTVSLVPDDLWAVKHIDRCDFWFLKEAPGAPVDPPTAAIEATEDAVIAESTDAEVKQDQLMVSLPKIVVNLEGEVGKRTVPLLIVEMSFTGNVSNWTSKLYVEAFLELEVAYFNERVAVWEPLVEPLPNNGSQKRWGMELRVMQNEDIPMQDIDEEVDYGQLLPKMTIVLHSEDLLNITVTKSCLDVLTNLGKAFNDAYNLVETTVKADEIVTPLVLANVTGVDVYIVLDSTLEAPENSKDQRVELQTGSRLGVNENVTKEAKDSVIRTTQNVQMNKFLLEMPQYSVVRELLVSRVKQSIYEFSPAVDYPGDKWSLLVDVASAYGQKTITIQSAVQIENHLSCVVEAYYSSGGALVSCGLIQPAETFSLPFQALYKSSGDIHVRPHLDTYKASIESVRWKDEAGSKQLECPSTSGHSSFFLNVKAREENVYYENNRDKNKTVKTFDIYPSVVLHNLLPYPITCLLEGTEENREFAAGENQPLHHINVGRTNIEIKMIYQGKEWFARREIIAKPPQLSTILFSTCDTDTKDLELGLHNNTEFGTMDITLYAPYWMINKTGQSLFYKAESTGSDDEVLAEHPANCDDITLFSVRSRNIFSKKKDADSQKDKKRTDDKKGSDKKGDDKKGDDKKGSQVKKMKQSGKAALKIGDSQWSDQFSLDTVASSGTITCKSSNDKAAPKEAGVTISLTSSGLTKIVTFTPYYMMVNTADYSVLCTEDEASGNWIEIQPGACQPLWPTQTSKNITMRLKVKDDEVITNPFFINKVHSSFLRLDNQYGGINVECHATEAAMVTTFAPYKPGSVTVLLVNHTDSCTVDFHQSGVKETRSIESQHAMYYTWDKTEEKLQLVWSCGESKDNKIDLDKDDIKEFFYNSDTKVYWVSFLDGLQRVLLFTNDLVTATVAQQAGELEQVDQEVTLSIRGLGVSLVNNETQTEVIFLGIASSGIIWEERRRRRYKALNLKTCQALEAAHVKYQNQLTTGHSIKAHVTLDNKMEVDFENMRLLKPNKRALRRSFQDGVWVTYSASAHQTQLHAKINKLQIDNQLSGAVFQTILASTPPPKSIAADSVPKPFAEVSMVMGKQEHSDVMQLKYGMVLIQEMTVQVDQGIINALIELFSANDRVSYEQETHQLREDVASTTTPLLTLIGISLVQTRKMFYDHLHISPIKIHLSFSLQASASGDKASSINASVLNVFLQSVGVVLTDIQDVVFKLGYFQREHTFYTQSQLTRDVTSHYAGQALKQMYVLVLGLDVLGNPFGLLRGLGEGIGQLFYEPYQGAVQGPEEFAEGLALGVRSLFGSAVGGAAGAVSRITGTLGKGLAALTLDDDYQKKRREALNKRPANAAEGFARGGKGLVMGVFDGVTGIVRKPIEGAKQEGATGFFKGVVKGVVGVVTRPTSGVVDFASSSLEGIKRVVEMSSEIHRLRPPRRFHKDIIIRPYVHYEAEGYAILQETAKGRFKEDDYVGHLVVSKDKKHVVVATDQHLIMSSRGELFGSWDCDWSYNWNDFSQAPTASAKGFEIYLKEKEKKKSFFGGSHSKREILLYDKTYTEWLVAIMGEAMKTATR